MAQPIDRNEVDRLVIEHLPAILRFAQRLAGDQHVAEDVVQETLCRVLRRWRTFRGESSFKTWMLQIVVNVDRDRRRGQRPMEPMLENDPIAATRPPSELAAAAELNAEIRAAVDRLPERQREVALLTWSEGLTAADAARVLEITEANVYTNLHLARKSVARAIGVDYARRELP